MLTLMNRPFGRPTIASGRAWGFSESIVSGIVQISPELLDLDLVLRPDHQNERSAGRADVVFQQPRDDREVPAFVRGRREVGQVEIQKQGS